MKIKQTISSWLKQPGRQLEPSSGQAIVLVGVAALALIAIMGLAIDGGRLLFLSRETQNAADAAAIAAARALCAERTDYVQAGYNAAAANGFDNDENPGTVEINIPPTRASIEIDEDCEGCYVEVIVHGEIPASFIGLVYDGPLAATSHAIGACNPNQFNVEDDTGEVDMRAMWSIGDSCRTEITGANITVVGGAHANGELDFNPKNGGGIIVGPASYYSSWHNPADKSKWCPPDDCGSEYSDLVEGSGGSTTTTPAGACSATCFQEDSDDSGSDETGGTYPDTNPYQVAQSQPNPLEDRYPIEDFRPGGAQAIAAGSKYYSYTGGCGGVGNWFSSHTSGNVMDEGLYYTTCDIEMKQWDNITGNVTFVTEGSIKVVSNDNQTLTPFVDGLLMFANGGGDTCSSKTIQYSGSNNRWTGILYAPHGEVKFSASFNGSQIFGCVVAYDVKFSGSNNDIRCDEAFSEDETANNPGIWVSE